MSPHFRLKPADSAGLAGQLQILHVAQQVSTNQFLLGNHIHDLTPWAYFPISTVQSREAVFCLGWCGIVIHYTVPKSQSGTPAPYCGFRPDITEVFFNL
jgi:hypothetical protein